jgi:hypothetical protein
MNASPTDRLYELLPAILRIRDVEQGEPLRALMRIVQGELDRVDDDVSQMYDNWFIETCEEWVVPYIGDLLRVRPIHPVDAAGVTTRGYVANTLAYRRRKGTAVVLEQLARDTTGWPARAVECFARLATTQHMNHVRLAPTATPDIRDAEAAELTGSAFDRFAHTLDVRRIASGRGRYNIPNVALFLWRLQSYPIARPTDAGAPTDYATAREISDGGASPSGVYYTFNPVGLDSPLFNAPQEETSITHLAEEENVPGPLRRLALGQELDLIRKASAITPYVEPDGLRFMSADAPVFRVFIQATPGDQPKEVPRQNIYMCDIPDDVALASPPIDAVAVDPDRGRLALPFGQRAHAVTVTNSYGFPGDLGGGPYDRTASIDEVFTQADWQRGVSHLQATVPGVIVDSLRAAIQEWNPLGPGHTGVIALMDSLTDRDAASPAFLDIRVPAQSQLLIVAGDWLDPRSPGHFEPVDVRPHHVGSIVVHGDPGSGERGRLVINGLLLEGSVIVEDGALGTLEITHSTIVPPLIEPPTVGGELAVEVGNDDLHVIVSRSITGPIRSGAPITQLTVRDSLVLGGETASPDVVISAPETDVVIEQTTVFGTTAVRTIDASNSIFFGALTAVRRQQGCVRFSSLAAGSRTPRRYRCQPETAVATLIDQARRDAAASGVMLDAAAERALSDDERRRVTPEFESRRCGDPDFGQLTRRCAVEIRRGADNGLEMGAFSFLEQPQREANLRSVLDEYLRFGLEVGAFFVTLPRRKERR